MSDTSYSKLEDKGRPPSGRAPPKKGGEEKTKQISKKLDAVKHNMQDNIVKATERGKKMNDLEAQTESLENTGKSFHKTSKEVKTMFQWKAFLWQLAFAGVILLILAVITLYILNATGVLNRGSSGSSNQITATSSKPSSVTAATIGSKDDNNKAATEGEPCSLDGSGTQKCASDLECKARGKNYVGTGGTDPNLGVCRVSSPKSEPASSPTDAPAEKPADPPAEKPAECANGEVACTDALVSGGTNCIIGRCITAPAGATDSAPTDPPATPPLTAGSRVYNVLPGETAEATEAEIVNSLVTLHQHGADCVVGILHKDCTLDLLMKGWGVGQTAI